MSEVAFRKLYEFLALCKDFLFAHPLLSFVQLMHVDVFLAVKNVTFIQYISYIYRRAFEVFFRGNFEMKREEINRMHMDMFL